jgi:hypothetical protein
MSKPMKHFLILAVLALPLIGSATHATAQANRDHSEVTGSENSIREVTGRPPLPDDGGRRP